MRRAAMVVGLLLATAAAAAPTKLPKLPVDYMFAQGDGSPGKVTFSHQSHVDAARPTCLACHPRTFRILETGRDITGQPLKHERFQAGGACGSCHDGKKAFGLDSCENCHR